MEKFMLIFHGLQSNENLYQQMSPEQIQADTQKWNNWIGGIAAQGKLVSAEGLLPGGKLLSGTKKIMTDGPYTEGKEIVGGFLILHADNYDEAIEAAKGCPMFDVDGKVEVRQVQVFNM